MLKLIKPPTPLNPGQERPSVFLAGSIEMDKAENWQNRLIDALQTYPLTVYNPRRDAWDPSWVQSIDNPQFRAQVEWELDALTTASLILMYFDPNTKAPISLLELGLFAHSQKMIVCCPEGYWRKGNVDIVCARYQIPTVKDLDQLVEIAVARLGLG